MSNLRRITRTHRLRLTHVCGERSELEADDDVELLLRWLPEACELRPMATAPFPLNKRSNCGGRSATHWSSGSLK